MSPSCPTTNSFSRTGSSDFSSTTEAVRDASSRPGGRRCTLLFVNPDFVIYVKGRAHWRGDRESCSVFQLQVEAVLEDSPLPEEGDVVLKSGIRFGAGETSFESRARLRRRMIWH